MIIIDKGKQIIITILIQNNTSFYQKKKISQNYKIVDCRQLIINRILEQRNKQYKMKENQKPK